MSWLYFSEWVRMRWLGTDDDKNFTIEALGLAGEAGEVVDRLKKIYRQGRNDRPAEQQIEQLVLELGDMLHYTSRIMARYKLSLEYVLAMNVKKLEQRDKESGFTYGT